MPATGTSVLAKLDHLMRLANLLLLLRFIDLDLTLTSKVTLTTTPLLRTITIEVVLPASFAS
jgi:hypothetical protein